MNSIIKSLLVISAGTVLFSCSGSPKEESQQTVQTVEENVVPVVSAVLAQAQEVIQDQDYSSTVQPFAINNIAPQTSSRIERILVDVGSFVNAGQVLAEMDGVNLLQAKLKLKNEEAELARLKTLYAQGGLSQSDFEQSELAFKVNKSSCENLEKNTVLRSPINGVITARNYDKGDMYSMGQPIFVVQQISPVKLIIGVSETDYKKVKKGQEVSIKADAIPGQVFSGKVNKIYPVADASSHTFNVEILYANKDHMLRPGMYAGVNVVFGVNHSVVVPDIAVIKQQGSGQRFVYVLKKDNTVEMKNVVLGRQMGTKFEILEGLKDGEMVVTKGQNSLRNGIKVEVAK